MDVDLAEGDGVGEGALAAVGHGDIEHEVGAEHDHAGDPREEDVEAGDEELRGVEGCEIWREVWCAGVGIWIGPAEDGEGKQPGGEPGVEDVGLLGDVGGVAGATCGRRCAGDGDGRAGFAVPCGDAMTPPQLARDAPVVDVLHPLVVGFAVLVGRELDVALCDCCDGFGCDAVAAGAGGLVDGEEPLEESARLDDDAGALADADGVGVLFDFNEEAKGFEVGDDAFACLVAV